jgi:hypothetical protein
MGISKESVPVAAEIPGMYEGRYTDQGGMVVAFETIAAGDPAPLYRGLPDDRCQAHHWGFVFKGTLVIRYADREDRVQAGQAYYMAPGHLPLIEEDVEVVEFTRTEELEATMAQVQANLVAAGLVA